MKIIKRIAEEDYCFHELHFDDIEEYRQEYPKFINTYCEVKKKIAKVKESQPPFEGKEYAKENNTNKSNN